jgi:hypothetical protein
MGLPCFAVSVIADLGVEGKIVYTTHVKEEAAKTEAGMTTIMTQQICIIKFFKKTCVYYPSP